MKSNPSPARLRALAAVLLALGLSTAWAQQNQDRITLRSQQSVDVEITGESIKGITTRGPSFDLPGISSIRYSDAPFAFNEGQRHREQGRYDEAVKLYRSALADPRARKFWLEPNCRYYMALCYLEAGDLDKAEPGYKELLQKHPDTRFLPNALLGLGRVHYQKKDYPAAADSFAQLARKAEAEKWGDWQFRALLWEGKALLEQKEYTRALQSVRKIIEGAQNGKYEDIVTQAKAVQATIYVRNGEYERAAKLLNRLIEDLAPTVAKEVEKGGTTRMRRTEAQCKNALGHCFLKQASKTRDPKEKKQNLEEARLAFLWTVVLYQNLHAERAEALHYAAACFEKLGEKTRAAELQSELTQLYPNAKFED